MGFPRRPSFHEVTTQLVHRLAGDSACSPPPLWRPEHAAVASLDQWPVFAKGNAST